MKRSDVPSLDDLRAFETVARLGSVRAAAAELALTHGAVSRRVSKLSVDLGLRLLEAHGRGVRLTSDGEKLAEATGKAFSSITDALAEIRSGSAPIPIILSCERSLAMRWLIPRLSGFQDRYPDVEVHLSTGGGGLDFARDRVTLAIRRLDFLVDPEWSIIRLMPERVGPVMLPSLRKRFESWRLCGARITDATECLGSLVRRTHGCAASSNDPIAGSSLSDGRSGPGRSWRCSCTPSHRSG